METHRRKTGFTLIVLSAVEEVTSTQKTILGISAILMGLASLAGAYSGGSGTAEDPYQIGNAQDLIDLGQTWEDYDKSFVLTADIDLADWVFDEAVIAPDRVRSITSLLVGAPFSGRFDGQGHVIHNLCIEDPTADYQGLFGKLDAGAEIANLGLEGVQVSGHEFVGGLVGRNDSGTILSSYSTGTVSGHETVGGLVGRNVGTISSSYSTGMDRGGDSVGGLVGVNSGTISSSYSSGMVRGEGRVGGLVGRTSSGTISSSYSSCTVHGTAHAVGGLVGQTSLGTISSSYSTGRVSGSRQVGGLAGNNNRGTISSSHSTGRVYGHYHVGGLVGFISGSGTILSSYSSGPVHGTYSVGGLVGSRARFWSGMISSSYSSGRVFGVRDVGGLIGMLSESGTISSSFWDMESSEQSRSQGGIGLTAERMRDSPIYLEAGWDFMDESANGIEDIWWMPQGGTPRLWWQYGQAHFPSPIDKASTGLRDLTLQWRPGGPGIQHDVYLSDEEAIVADANTASQDVFLGRQSADTLSYDLHGLEPDKTYYWRIDGVNDVDAAQLWKGTIWSFTITDFVSVHVLDDFESYDDDCNRIYFTWQDGWGHSGDVEKCQVAPYAGNETGATVGNTDPPYASHIIVRDGSQSLPVYYDNASWPWFSEAERSWSVPQDWTIHGADALTLYFRGEAENGQDPLYIVIEDSHGGIAVTDHPSASAVLGTEGRAWHIALADLDATGVDIGAIKKMVIGVGNRDTPQFALSTGKLYIDDIQLTKRVP